MCVPPNFVDWAVQLGFETRALGIEMRAPRPGAPVVVPDLIADQFEVLGSAVEGCDLIVGCGAHQYSARSFAELHRIPFVIAVYAPNAIPTPELAPAGTAKGSDDAAANLRMWDENKRRWNERSLEQVNVNRARLSLEPLVDVLGHILGDCPWLAADATLGPAPSIPGMSVVQTGAWVLEDFRPLPRELEVFLDAGDPPLYLGFGSMPAAKEASRALIEGARAVGRRAILSEGWAELERIDGEADCVVVGDVNHQSLFERVAAVVHHGGAGTMTAAALAGVPQVIVPMFGDQFYWGARLSSLGVGSVVSFQEMDADSLASAIHEVLQSRVTTRARSLSSQVSSGGASIAAQRLIETFG